MTKIESVSCTVAKIPLDNATAFSTRMVHDRHYLLVKVRTDDGIEGIGFCYVGSAAGRLGVVAVEDLLAPIVIGKDPLQVEKIWKDMYQESLLQGRMGTVMRALSA
ncbi:MAG: mandelate racemase/muconate lactonizing enzyme family protein, partial [Alphaproteobacteria bacterium]|nr:mandelate racemase/muconate lactonizing enzyme family protein [Alphaproteobacteria bacterium]